MLSFTAATDDEPGGGDTIVSSQPTSSYSPSSFPPTPNNNSFYFLLGVGRRRRKRSTDEEKRNPLFFPSFPTPNAGGTGAMCVRPVDFDVACLNGQFRILQRSSSTHEPSDPLPRVVLKKRKLSRYFAGVIPGYDRAQ